jgi:hypothetical protein
VARITIIAKSKVDAEFVDVVAILDCRRNPSGIFKTLLFQRELIATNQAVQRTGVPSADL